MRQTTGYPIPETGSGWIKQRLAALRESISEVRRLAQANARLVTERAIGGHLSAGLGISLLGDGTLASPVVVALDPVPEIVEVFGTNTVNTVTAGAGAWEDIDGCDVAFDLDRELVVMAEVVGNVVAGSTASYTMIGVDASGARTLIPETSDEGDTLEFGLTGYFRGATTDIATVMGRKKITLPSGVSTLKGRMRRQTTSGTHTVSYPMLRIIPVKWGELPSVPDVFQATFTADFE